MASGLSCGVALCHATLRLQYTPAALCRLSRVPHLPQAAEARAALLQPGLCRVTKSLPPWRYSAIAIGQGQLVARHRKSRCTVLGLSLATWRLLEDLVKGVCSV